MTDHPGSGEQPPDPAADPTDPAGQPDVGDVGEEAAKLLGALSDWARESSAAGAVSNLGPGLGQGISGLAGQAAQVMSGLDQHLATGAPECTWCPVCRTVHLVRGASPEVKAHLAAAGSSFLQAVASMLATLPAAAAGGSAPGAEFEKIDLDGDDDD